MDYTVHGVAKNSSRLSNFHFRMSIHIPVPHCSDYCSFVASATAGRSYDELRVLALPQRAHLMGAKVKTSESSVGQHSLI